MPTKWNEEVFLALVKILVLKKENCTILLGERRILTSRVYCFPIKQCEFKRANTSRYSEYGFGVFSVIAPSALTYPPRHQFIENRDSVYLEYPLPETLPRENLRNGPLYLGQRQIFISHHLIPYVFSIERDYFIQKILQPL